MLHLIVVRVWVNVQDYSWEDHGFSLMNRLYGEMAQLLDEKFQVVCALTYHTMAMHANVDTSTLRKALWNYIHCIFGIRSVLMIKQHLINQNL